MSGFFSPEHFAALTTLVALEIVLGIDNIVFLTIIVGRLEKSQRELGRRTGLLLAMGMRVLLLLTLSHIMLLTSPVITMFNHGFSWRDLILLAGGLFLIGKATHEIHEKIEMASAPESTNKKRVAFWKVLVQIVAIDLIFSIDSVITAVGMANDLSIMIIAVVIAVLVMMFFARPVGDFVDDNPTFKMLALSFLLLIGMMLIADSFGHHIEKGYMYFAIGFSLLVEMLNLKLRKAESSAKSH